MRDVAEIGKRVAETVKDLIAKAVAPLQARVDALEARPLPVDGKDGRDGVDGQPGPQGERGEPGAAGPQGPMGEPASLDLVRALIEAEVHKSMASIPRPRDGIDGKDGRDGFSPEDLQLELDGRSLTVKLLRGDVIVERAVTVPALIYRGVFAEGAEYEPGDMVTWGGSLWHCNKATALRPETPESREQWTLAAKRGRDGKSGEKGERGPEGKAAKGWQP